MACSRFDGWTRRRAGWGLGGVAAGLVGAAAGQDASAKKKKKCPKPPRCPNSCTFVFYEPGPNGGEICGTGNGLQSGGSPCVPCSSSNPCTNAAFPHCLNSFEIRSSGEILYFTNACGAYADGVCGNVSACVT